MTFDTDILGTAVVRDPSPRRLLKTVGLNSLEEASKVYWESLR